MIIFQSVDKHFYAYKINTKKITPSVPCRYDMRKAPYEWCVMNNDQSRMFANRIHTLRHTPVGQQCIPVTGATALLIQPEVEMILAHSGAFPLCTCVLRVV